MNDGKILVLTAVEMEARAIRRAVPGIPVRAIGIRARHLPAEAEIQDISLLILAGVAGGLDPQLTVGKVIIDTSIKLNVSFRTGKIHTTDQIVGTPEAKAHLFTQTGALAVDMEQTILRSFADRLGIPLISVRAISDTADQFLDPRVVSLIDGLGRPRPIQIAATLLRDPSFIKYLWQLNSNTKYALMKLTEALKVILQVLPSCQLPTSKKNNF